MPVQTTSIPARDGFHLGATVHEPDAPLSPPGADAPGSPVVVVNPAVGVKQTFYQRFAAYLATQGIVAATFDYRGLGRSRPGPLKGFEARLHEWGTKDLPGVIDWLTDRYPGAPLFVVGHSVGGQLPGLADNNRRLAGLVTVCAQSGDWRLWPVPRRYLLAGLWYVAVPTATCLLGYLPGWLGLGEDLPRGVALEWARWCRSRGYLTPHLGETVPDHFAAFRGPILAYSSADDRLAPERAVDALLRLYTGADPVTRRHLHPRELGIPALGHFGFFRKEGADLWPDVARWLHAQEGPASAPSLDRTFSSPNPRS